jgi:hypothetical protein
MEPQASFDRIEEEERFLVASPWNDGGYQFPITALISAPLLLGAYPLF